MFGPHLNGATTLDRTTLSITVQRYHFLSFVCYPQCRDKGTRVDVVVLTAVAPFKQKGV
jgi:hypothetical protein